MTFWILTAALALIVATLLALALRAPKADQYIAPAAYDLRVYRDQLREVDKDLARGVVSAEDAERVRAEISRRILGADAAMSDDARMVDAGRGAPRLLAGALAATLIGASFGLYFWLGAPGYGDLGLERRIALAEETRLTRPDQAAAEASLPTFAPPANTSPDYVALVTQLRDTVAERPGDLQGHILLQQNEANLGNFVAAARAQARVVALKGETALAEDYAQLADMLVLAAGGYVSPEAEAALQQALALAPANGTARYYIALMMAQTGRPDRAFRIWDQQLREGPPDAPWIPPIRAQIPDLAARAGVNYQLPDVGSGRGPSADDIEAAQDMSPTDRMAMIESMVSGLSDRLATDGGPVEDWAQLITALGVLERRGEARAIYENAIDVFGDDLTAIDLLNRAGQRAGVAE
ncbi:MAG: c-type cytochrome biogenesis protein CcmI [Pseudomonadota bacterium]